MFCKRRIGNRAGLSHGEIGVGLVKSEAPHINHGINTRTLAKA